MKTAALLIIGDEVLAGEVQDANGPYALRRLADHGVPVLRLAVVPDRRGDIAAELRRLRAVADAVIVSGGLGPTHDDQTRPALADVVGTPLVEMPGMVERIRGYYGDRTTEAELTMALAPEGTRVVAGPRTGTFGYAVGGLYAFPGVPFLFRDLLDAVLPEFQARDLLRREFVSARREGELATELAALQAAHPTVALGSYPVFEDGDWHVRVVARAEGEEELEEVAEALARLV